MINKTWPGFSKKNTVIIPLDINSVSFKRETLNIFNIIYEPKEELHITLIGKKSGSFLRQNIDENPVIEKQLKDRFESIDWSFKQSGPIHLLSRTKEKLNDSGKSYSFIQKSIILLIEMRGMDQFYKALRALKLLSEEVAIPPPHITLYTHNCPHGIGVPSVEKLSLLTERVIPKENLLSDDT